MEIEIKLQSALTLAFEEFRTKENNLTAAIQDKTETFFTKDIDPELKSLQDRLWGDLLGEVESKYDNVREAIKDDDAELLVQ